MRGPESVSSQDERAFLRWEIVRQFMNVHQDSYSEADIEAILKHAKKISEFVLADNPTIADVMYGVQPIPALVVEDSK